MTCDLLIQGGTVIDPSQSLHAPMDVAISNGVIAELAPSLDASQAATTVDARDQLVIPGLIDLHVHVYHRHVPIRWNPIRSARRVESRRCSMPAVPAA